MNMRDTQPWQMHAFGTGLLIVLACGVYLLQIGPALSRHEHAKAQAAELVTEQTASRELERTLLLLKDRVSVAARDAGKAELKLEPAGELNARLARLNELAAGNGLRVDSIESGQTAHFPRYSTIAVRLSGQGSYQNCAAFLKQLHTSMPDLTVIGINMGSASVSSDTTATFALDVLWYTRPPEPVKKN